MAPANVGKREVQANCRRHLSICYCPELQNNRLSISTGLASAQSSSRKATHSSYTESQQADNADSQTRTVRKTKHRRLNKPELCVLKSRIWTLLKGGLPNICGAFTAFQTVFTGAVVRKARPSEALLTRVAPAFLTTKGYDHKTPIRTSFEQRFNRYAQLSLPQSELPQDTTTSRLHQWNCSGARSRNAWCFVIILIRCKLAELGQGTLRYTGVSANLVPGPALPRPDPRNTPRGNCRPCPGLL